MAENCNCHRGEKEYSHRQLFQVKFQREEAKVMERMSNPSKELRPTIMAIMMIWKNDISDRFIISRGSECIDGSPELVLFISRRQKLAALFVLGF